MVADFFSSIGNVVVDRTPDELITAVIAALVLSLAMAGLYWIGRRDLRENLMPIVGLMIVANLLSMAVSAGYVARVKRKPVQSNNIGRGPHGAPAGLEAAWTDAIFRTADLNRDGLLSDDEASYAARQFVRSADSSGKGAIDPRSLGRAIVNIEFHGRGRNRRAPEQGDRPAADHSTHTQAVSPPEALSEPIRPRADAEAEEDTAAYESTPMSAGPASRQVTPLP
jgi:hypothetical protein